MSDASRGPVARLNRAANEEAVRSLLMCCGSRRWAEQMADARPFRTLEEVLDRADRIWSGLEPADWLDAFRAHPRIGQRGPGREPRPDAAAARWSEEEQSGARAAPRTMLDRLARANRDYEERFGYIFIVCATGRSADEMLAALLERLPNDKAREIRIAAGEQAKITRLRLQKLPT